jgi:phage shock protein C
MEDRNDVGRTVGLIGGGALIFFGAWFLLRQFGLIPDRFFDIWGRASWPIAIIIVGVIVLSASMRGGLAIRGPLPGSRLYRARTDKWVGGVLGGLGRYLGIDPVILRLGFVVFMLAGWGGIVVAYIIMAIIVPLEPADGAVSAPPAAPTA